MIEALGVLSLHSISIRMVWTQLRRQISRLLLPLFSGDDDPISRFLCLLFRFTYIQKSIRICNLFRCANRLAEIRSTECRTWMGC